MSEIIIRYAHFLSIFVLFALLTAEHLLLKPQVSRADMKRLGIIDIAYGVTALVVLAAGLALWMGVGKPAEFYTKNPVFHAKFGLFILIGLLSIAPTVFFIKQRKTTAESITVPKSLIHIVRLELTLLVAMPLLAVLMAKGIGLPS
ncbi:conserved hypothetical protein [gamma proteobacterium HTCC5015]|nr:conserved hypothetical protein [gamma proteobacterium HTCC5015]